MYASGGEIGQAERKVGAPFVARRHKGWTILRVSREYFPLVCTLVSIELGSVAGVSKRESKELLVNMFCLMYCRTIGESSVFHLSDKPAREEEVKFRRPNNPYSFSSRRQKKGIASTFCSRCPVFPSSRQNKGEIKVFPPHTHTYARDRSS